MKPRRTRSTRRRAAALEYEPSRDRAPRLLARGEGLTAERILDIARREGIPIHEDAPLVEILSRLEIEREIPPELYRVVAEVIAFVFRLQAAAGRLAPSPDREPQ